MEIRVYKLVQIPPRLFRGVGVFPIFLIGRAATMQGTVPKRRRRRPKLPHYTVS